MRRSWKRSALLTAACALSAAFAVTLPTVAEPRVAGFDELVVMTPGTMDRDLSGVDLTLDPELGWQANVQPTLHVHRNYYNGDKEFQGPLLAGGPTIVCACHPRTGKRLYAEVNLPSGAPIIVYDEDSITYVFREQRVVLGFRQRHGCEEVVVTFKHGRGLCRVKQEHEAALVKHHQQMKQTNPLSRSVHEAAKKVHSTVKGAAGTATTVAAGAVTRAKDGISSLPGIQHLQSLGDQSTSRQNIESLKQAAIKSQDEVTEYIKTNR